MARRSNPDLITFSSLVYRDVRAEILAGRLPPGQKLRIGVLATRYDAGSSPVREALNRLSAERLVERREQRGFYVASISSADFDELVQTRCWLEELALRESMKRGGPAWRETLLLTFHRMSSVPRSTSQDVYTENPEWERCHREWHRSLLSGCGSARLMAYCEDLTDQAYRYRQLAIKTSFPSSRDVQAEHESLLRAVLAGHADSAVQLLTDHYRRTAAIVRESESSTPTAIAAASNAVRPGARDDKGPLVIR